MKKVYNNPVTEVTLINACSVLCASGDNNSSPVLTTTGDKGTPKLAAF